MMFFSRALYRPALALITSFSLCLLAMQAMANPFVVQGIPVDETANNAVTARTQAMTNAQTQAWDAMIAALVEAGEPVQYIQKPDPLTIGGLVETMEVSGEQTTPTRYIANIDVIFSESAMRNHLARSGVRLSLAPQVKPVLLLPWYRDIRGVMHFWGPDNDWYPIWADKSGRTDPPVRIPTGDVKDVEMVSATRPETLDPMQVQNLLDRYDLSQVVVAVAKRETPQRISLTLNSLTSGGLRQVASETINAADPNQDEDILLHQAVTRTLVMLRDATSGVQSSMATTQAQFDPAETGPIMPVTRNYEAIAVTANLNEWIGMKKRLDQALGAENVQVTAMSPGRIELLLTGPEIFTDFAGRLSLYGMSAEPSTNPTQPILIRSR